MSARSRQGALFPLEVAAVAALAAPLALPSFAFAREPRRESRRLDLVWSQGDPSCVSAETLVRAVERTLGRPVFRGDGAALGEVSGEASASSPRSYTAHVVLRLPDGQAMAERTLAAREDCHRLDESIAVVIALMVDELERQTARRGTAPASLALSFPHPAAPALIHTEPPRLELARPFARFDPSALPGASPEARPAIPLETREIPPTIRMTKIADADVVPPPLPSPTEVMASAPTPSPASSVAVPPIAFPVGEPVPEQPPPPAAPRPSAPLTYGVAAGVSAMGVLFPNVTFGGVVRAELDVLRFLAISLAVRSFGPATVLLVDGRGGSFWGWGAEGAICPFFAPSARVALGGCVGVSAGTMTGTGNNLAASQSFVRPLVLATVAPELRVRVTGPFWLRADAGLLVPLVQELWQFKVDQSQTYVQVLDTANVAPFAAISAEYRSGS